MGGRQERVERELSSKMKRIVSLAFAAALSGLAAGCTSAGHGPVPSLAFGAFPGTGDPANHLAGAQLVSALNGGIIATDISARMDSGVRSKALQAEYQALEYTPAGQKVTWGKSGDRFNGEVVASQPYRVGSQDCRPYTHTITADGVSEKTRGTACRNPDGSWTPLT
jgi:surface antigen